MTGKTRKKRGSNAAGERVRAELLKTAIALFAQHGYAGVSTRQITKEAGVNQAAIYYYFKTKREIYIEAVVRCFNDVANNRLKALAKAESLPTPSLEDILHAFIAPHVQYVSRREGRDYLRIFATFSATPEDILTELYTYHFGPHRVKFMEAIRRIEPNFDDEVLHRAFGVISNMIVSALFDHGYEATSGKKALQADVDSLIDMLVKYNAAGLRAVAN